MNSRTTLILAIVFAIVSGVYIAGELAKNKKAEKELKEKRIFTITPEKATSVILAKSREAIRFEKKDGILIITSPDSHLAKNWDFGNMLYLITELKKDEVIKGGDPAEFGLRPPSLIVTVSDGEKEETLLVGRRNYTGVSAYAKLDGGDDVFMVSSIGINDAEGKLGSFIDKGLLSCEPDKCDKLTIRNGTESMELIQKDGKWSMSKPAKRKIDGGKVLVYLQALSGVEGGDVREGHIRHGGGQGRKGLQLPEKARLGNNDHHEGGLRELLPHKARQVRRHEDIQLRVRGRGKGQALLQGENPSFRKEQGVGA